MSEATNNLQEGANGMDVQRMARDFVKMLDTWHALNDVYDDNLDRQIHRWYADYTPVKVQRPYFSPSSINADKRELYLKQTGARRDVMERQAHQGRWTRLGTAIGDIIQRDILFIGKHYERMVGHKPPFEFEFNEDGTPMFEEFAKRNVPVAYKGNLFYLYGTCDGIMKYRSPSGEVVRVGLEIKSKQTTNARTSRFSMKHAEDKHFKQCVGYSLMYGVDYYIVLYVNASKKAWVMSEEDVRKTPDIRAFGYEITYENQLEVIEYLSDVMEAVKNEVPPKLDLHKWTFNNYKTACALSLTDEEYKTVKREVNIMLESDRPNFIKNGYKNALDFINDMTGRN